MVAGSEILDGIDDTVTEIFRERLKCRGISVEACKVAQALFVAARIPAHGAGLYVNGTGNGLSQHGPLQSVAKLHR